MPANTHHTTFAKYVEVYLCLVSVSNKTCRLMALRPSKCALCFPNNIFMYQQCQRGEQSAHLIPPQGGASAALFPLPCSLLWSHSYLLVFSFPALVPTQLSCLPSSSSTASNSVPFLMSKRWLRLASRNPSSGWFSLAPLPSICRRTLCPNPFCISPVGLQYSSQVLVGLSPFNFCPNWGHVTPFGDHAQPNQLSFCDV